MIQICQCEVFYGEILGFHEGFLLYESHVVIDISNTLISNILNLWLLQELESFLMPPENVQAAAIISFCLVYYKLLLWHVLDH